MTNSPTQSQITRERPLRCPECGCSNFVEVVSERTSSRAVFYDRVEYPQVSDQPFARDVDEIQIHCDGCNWLAVQNELVDASRDAAA